VRSGGRICPGVMNPAKRDLLGVPGFARRLLIASGLIIAFACLSGVCLSLSSQALWVVFIPAACLLALTAVGVIALASAGSPAALIGVFATLLFVTDGDFRVKAIGEPTLESLDWQSLLKFGVWLGCGLVGLRYFLTADRILAHPGAALWLAYVSIALLSASYAPSPTFSFGYAFSLLNVYVFTIALVETLSERQILWTVTLTLAVFLIVSWPVYYVFPALGEFKDVTASGFEYRMSGLGGSPNVLGSVCSIYLGAVFLLLWKRYCTMKAALPLVALGIVTLVATDSRTEFLASAAGLAAVIFTRSIWRLGAVGLVFAFGLLAVLSLPMRLEGTLGHLISRSGDPAELVQLEGRTQIWDVTWERILERPLLGWGYNSSKVVLANYRDFADNLRIDEAHNLLLQNLLSVGLIGTLPLIGLLLKLMADIGRDRPAALSVLFVTMAFVTGITEGAAVGGTPTVVTVMFMLGSLMPWRRSGPAQMLPGRSSKGRGASRTVQPARPGLENQL
jgi:O-antigen ligase